MKNKLLIIAWTVYPSSGGSAIVLSNIADGFESEELVIVGQLPEKMPTIKWESRSDVRLYYLNPFPFSRRRPEKFIRWVKLSRMISQVERIVRQENITSILSIFPDEYYSYIGYRVSKNLDLPYYFWLHNSYLENRKGILKKLAQYLEPKFLNHANKVFVMSDGLNREMSSNYPNVKFETLVHGFNLERSKLINTKTEKSSVKFFYSGALNDSCMDASLRMLKVILKNKQFEVHISSGNPQTFRENGIDGDQVIFHEFLPFDEFIDSLKNYDVMLLPHGIDGSRSDFEYRTIFPTRTIPLLFSGKPILAHCPKNSFLTEFLIESDCALVISEKNEEEIEKGIEKLLLDEKYVEKIVQNAFKASKRFELKRVIEKLKLHIEN